MSYVKDNHHSCIEGMDSGSWESGIHAGHCAVLCSAKDLAMRVTESHSFSPTRMNSDGASLADEPHEALPAKPRVGLLDPQEVRAEAALHGALLWVPGGDP